jgi:hypothetical protein
MLEKVFFGEISSRNAPTRHRNWKRRMPVAQMQTARKREGRICEEARKKRSFSRKIIAKEKRGQAEGPELRKTANANPRTCRDTSWWI